MKLLRELRKKLILPLIGLVFATSTIVSTPVTTPVYAEPETSEETAEESSTSETTETNTCYDQIGALGWFICPGTGVLANAIDNIYEFIEKLLTVQPVTTDTGSPIYRVWQYMRDITNIVFIIFLLVVVYSQITGLGISNYGIKKALPKLIVCAILVNTSYLICSLLVDVSNILGASLRGFFSNIELQAINANSSLAAAKDINWNYIVLAVTGGGAGLALISGLTGGLSQLLWPLLAALVGAIISVIIGLITIGLRQALISVLIMISPLAFVAYMLPNTESYFDKWKKMFTSMLVFYPMFSVLFGAAQLAGWAIIASASGEAAAFFVIVGLAVQVFPLFLAISLLKMSGTVLGAVSNKLNGLTSGARSGVKDWTESRRAQQRENFLANSNRPSAGLRRYLDARARRREIDTENARAIRKGKAEYWAQRSILGSQKYDPAYDPGQQKLRTSQYTRNAKLASNIGMNVKQSQDDTSNVISRYGSYHNSTRYDKYLSDQGAKSFVEMNRAAFTLVSNDEDDYNFLTDQYIKAANAGPDSYQYKHFVKSAGGGLGEKGATSVLGQMIAKTAANEARHQHDFEILGRKFGVTKRDFRDMAVGYYNDDNGLATFAPDENGKRQKAFYYETNADGSYKLDDKGERIKVYETFPGEFLSTHPEALHPYEKVDAVNGPYYDMRDKNGKFITRIYKHNNAVLKDIFKTFDTPIQDPIDGLYGILAGIEEGQYANITNEAGNVIADLPNVGLGTIRTTIAGALQAAHFNEKAAFAGPMYTAAVANGYVKNFVDQNIQRLDNILKTVKSGRFNQQDKFELELLAKLMNTLNADDPDAALRKLFPENLLRESRNVNGEYIEGVELTPEGKIDKSIAPVDHKHATYEQLLNTVKGKYLYPAAASMLYMMSKGNTPSTADALKSGGDEAWNALFSVLDKLKDKPGVPNPYKRSGAQISDTVSYINQESRRFSNTSPSNHGAFSSDQTSSENIVRDHLKQTADRHINARHDSLRARAANYLTQIRAYRDAFAYDAFQFSQQTLAVFGDDPDFEDVYYAFTDFIDSNPDATTDDMYDFLDECFLYFENLD